ncbi:DUF697 domain-containing protein [Parvularcula marina]|uniref:DUF697 domain-containing protein n=1 Tax=Parvularcula marina TaxID=2292771 RepID=UPI0035132D3B
MPIWTRQRAPAEVPPAEAAEDTPAEERWEISAQWKRAWAAIKWTAYGAAMLAALVIIGQVYLFASMFFGIHPLLGGIFLGFVTVALVWFVLRPAWRFLRMPAVAVPPDVELGDPALTHRDVEQRTLYDLNYLKNMRRNPALTDEHEGIDAAILDLEKLRQAEKHIDPKVAGEEINRFEQERILPLLTGLDKKIDAYIRKEALGVGTATAVSLNGTVDAFIVLWRNVNMISRIGRLYYGRPSLRLSFKIIGDVAASVVLSRVADDLSETAGDTLRGVMNRLGGVVAGPLMDGSVNALMTMKLGYAAKRRCRSFDVWSKRKALQVASDVVEQVQRDSASLISDLVKACGGVTGTAMDVAGKAMAAPKSAWSIVQNTVGKRMRPKESSEPS